jgi:hypothetical protein
MADQTNKEFAPVEACRELSKGLKELINQYESQLADLRERELKKNSAQLIPGGDAPANMDNMEMSELPAAKEMKPAKPTIKQSCKSCGKAHAINKCMKKGETFIDLKNSTDGVNSGEQGKRLKDVGVETSRIPKPKKITPKNHAEGGNDGANIKTNSAGGLNKGDVPMAKPPSGGTGLAPKAPAMAKPAAPAGGMPKPPMIAKAGMSDSSRTHNSTGSALPKAPKNSTGSVQPLGDAEPAMTKAGARMTNPKVEQGKPSINTLGKAALPGTMQGDMLSASHKAAQPAAPAPKQATIRIPGRAQALADFTPAGKFTAAGAALPGAAPVSAQKKPIALPGKGKPAVSTVNPAAAHLTAPPPAVRPPAAAPAQKPMGKPMGTAAPSMPPEQPKINRFGKSEDFGKCALCGHPEHSGNC